MKLCTMMSGSLALLSMIGVNNVLHASDPLIQGNFFVANEERLQWVNEQDGRTGVLEVNGALLSSPCMLMTNEISLPLTPEGPAVAARYPLKLTLAGCGEGGSVTSASSVAGIASTMVVHSALLMGYGDVLQPELHKVGAGRLSLHGGDNLLTYFLNAEQQQALAGMPPYANTSRTSQNDTLRLRLDYE